MHSGLAAIDWVQPGALAGLAAVALPVAAHLWSQRSGPPAMFSSIRLVLEAQHRISRRHLWRDRVLMLLRCAVVALLVLALAQPIWRTGAQASAAPADPGESSVLLVLDGSASMRRAVRGRPLFRQAVDEAQRVLRSLQGSAAQATVVVAGDAPQRVWPQPTARFDALAEALTSVEPGFGYVDLAATVAAVHAEATSVHVFTDAQATSRVGALDAAAGPVRPIVHHVGADLPADNMALAEPRLDPTRPIIGRASTFSVDVVNHSNTQRDARVIIDGPFGSVAQRLTVEAGGRATIAQPVRFDTGEPVELAARLAEPDAFTLDDRVALMARPRERYRVGIVTEPGVRIDDPDEPAYYLHRAVSPGDAGVYDVTPISRGTAAPAVPIDVFITLTRPDHEVRQRVDRGAGRWHIGPLYDAAPSLDGRTLVPAQPSQSPWRAFEGEALATLMNVSFGRTWRATETGAAEVFARWPDETPGMTLQRTGGGPLIHLAASIDPADSDLVRSSAFVALVHELLAMLRPQATTATITAGTRSTVDLPAAGDTGGGRCIAPDGRAIDATIRVTEAGRTLRARFDRPGVYRVIDDAGRVIAAATVLIDPRESDLRIAASAHATAAAGHEAPRSLRRSDAAIAASPGDTARALWPACLAAAFALVVLETLVAAPGGRRRMTRARDELAVDLRAEAGAAA